MANFLWGAAGGKMTPKQVSEQRRVAQALMAQASDTSPVGHWSAAVNRGLQGWLGGRDAYKAREAENAGMAEGQALIAALTGAPTAGAMTPESSPVSGSSTFTPPAEAAAIREGLIARGLPEHIADGFIMNFQDESGLNPGINERNPIVPGSRGGFGLYQLTGPRRTAYEQFAGQRGVDPSDVNAQLDWLMHELQGPEAKAAQSIFSSQNAGEAGAAIVNNFLRPAAEHRTSRANRYMGYGGQGASSNQIAAAMSNPWAMEAGGPVIQALMQQAQGRENMALEQQMRQADPMYQAQLAKLNAPPVDEVAQREANAARLGLQGDQAVMYALTGQIPGMGGQGTPAAIAELQWRAQEAGLQPGTPEYQSFIRSGGSNATGAPAAFEALRLQALAAGLEEGTPGYQEFMATRGAGLVAEAGVQGKARGEALAAAPSQIDSASDAVRYIEELRNHPGMSWGTGATALTGLIPGTDMADFRARVEQLEGGAFLTAIQEMQGMGALSNQEGQTAKAAVARMNTSVSEADFRKALDDYELIIRRGQERAQRKLSEAGNAKAGTATRRKFNPQTGAFE